MNSKKWNESLSLSSVPLREINERNLPINAASGCMIECKKKKLLITVEHATGNQGHWIIELKYDAKKGTQAYSLGTMIFLLKLSSGGAEPIDFSYVIIPDDIVAYSQEIDSKGKLISQKPISVFKPDFNILPRSGINYGFSGFVKVKRHCLNEQDYLLAERQTCTDLQYLKSENEMHYFSLKGKHPGHEEFKGCSGAPILDWDGNVVALVCGGNTHSNTIRGISLSRMKIPIYALVGNQ